MLDFIQDLSDSLPTNASTSGVRTKISNAQLIDCLIGQAIDDLVRNNGKEGLKAVAGNAQSLINMASNDVGSLKQLNVFVETKAKDYIERLKQVNSLADQGAIDQALVNSQARFAGLCLFLNKVMSRVSNSCYYRQMECDRHELEGAGYNISADYDGFSRVKLESIQVTKAVNAVFAEVTSAQASIVNAKLVDDWQATTFCTPCFATVKVGESYVAFDNFDEYVKHRTLSSQKVRLEAVATA